MGKVSEAVTALVQPIAESFGLELVEVTYEKRYDGMNLTVVIDKEGGVSINDCEKLHRAIDGPLDELDPIDGPYTLNVSSVGIDRPLKTPRDFRRNMGYKIAVKLYKPMDKKKTFQGVLKSFDEENFTIVTEKDVEMTFAIKDAALIEPVIEF